MALLERAPLTYEDYLSIPNDGRRHEIIDGAHCVSPAPSPEHQWVCSELAGERFGAPRELSAASGDSLTSHLLPGFGLTVERLFT
jgi:hypothetical protein